MSSIVGVQRTRRREGVQSLKMSQDGSKPYDGKTIPDNLPDGWEAVWDSNYERYYFYAAAWEESVWDIPTIGVVDEEKSCQCDGGDGNEAGGASHDGTVCDIC